MGLRPWVLFFFTAGIFSQAHAQNSPSWDSSGNGLLQGDYFVRNVVYVVGDQVGNLSRAIVIYGMIHFDGQGKYSLQGMTRDSNSSSSSPQSFSTTGTYTIAASGMGFLTSPISGDDSIYGLVSNGIFVGSSTESGFNDLFIATRVPSSPSTVASLQGTYWLAHMDFPGNDPVLARNSLFQLAADGQGNIAGTVQLNGYVGVSGSTAVTQTVQGLKYTFESGVGALLFPEGTLSNQTLIAGRKIFYVSQDGSFVFGGSPAGWDMFVGVRAGPGTVSNDSFSGLYFQVGLHEDLSQVSSGQKYIDTYYGALSASAGLIVDHQRTSTPFSDYPYDYTFRDSYSLNSNGTYDDPNQLQKYFVGKGGAVRISSGIGPYLGVSVAFKAAPFSGSGVFLNPAGVVNAASSAPFTAGIGPGELITLYGTNLASGSAVASATPFPTTLNSVQVMINNRAAPVYAVSPTQISAIVPYATEAPIAQIQVINNGTASNTVTYFVNLTAPGVFTVPPGGLGYGAVLHSDFSLVTTSNPAQVGETLAVYLTGLGDVSPSVPDGSAGPSNPLSVITSQISAYIDGQPAVVTYAGLAPTLAGLYQVNVQVPSGVRSGDVYFDISGPDSYNSQAVIPIKSGTAATSAKVRRRPAIRRPARNFQPVRRPR